MHGTSGRLNRFLILALCCASLLILSSCKNLRPARPDPATRLQPIYVPPTLAAIAQAGDSSSIEQPTSSNLSNCTNNLTFTGDITIPDGTFVERGAILDKQWEIQNTGTCNWTGDYSLRLIAGPEMGANSTQALIPATSGSKAVIDMKFTAPYEVGTYRSAWQAYDPFGQPFGDPFYIEIVVSDTNP
jgi:hypothetical protein